MFTSWGGAAAGSPLAAGRGILSVEQVHALQQMFVSSVRVALLLCAALAAVGVVTAIVRGEESKSGEISLAGRRTGGEP